MIASAPHHRSPPAAIPATRRVTALRWTPMEHGYRARRGPLWAEVRRYREGRWWWVASRVDWLGADRIDRTPPRGGATLDGEAGTESSLHDARRACRRVLARAITL